MSHLLRKGGVVSGGGGGGAFIGVAFVQMLMAICTDRWNLALNMLLLRNLMQSFQLNYLWTSTLHKILNKLVVVSLKSVRY